MESWVVLGVLLLLVVLAAGRRVRRETAQDRYEREERSGMPREIAEGKLVLSERYLTTDEPRRLGARFDQVYLTPAGVVVPVETKRRYRHAVYEYDRVELSVQAAVLANGGAKAVWRRPVATWGWVRVVAPGRKTVYLRTDLIPADTLVGWYERYFQLVEGRGDPLPAEHTGQCRKCAYQASCHYWTKGK